ncbi:MAG: transcriptional regulator [Pseudomonadota bacterium]
MQTFPKTRIEILIEAPLKARLAALLDAHGVSGYTIFSAKGGKGADGAWSRTGQIAEIGHMLLFVCILDKDKREGLLGALQDTLAPHIGYVLASDAEVIRPSKFP